MKKILFAILIFQACGQGKYISDYRNVPIVYDDIRRMNQILSSYSKTQIDENIIQSQYFNPASPGLTELIKKDGLSAQGFSQYLKKNYNFIKSICKEIDFIESDSTRLRSLLKKYSDTFSTAKYQPVYFLIGQNYHGGTVTNEGFVIELQLNSLGLKIIDFTSQDTTRISHYHDLDQIFIHEQVHVSREEQYISGSLKRMSIDEGSCDYIAYIITGKKGNPDTYLYGAENFESLKKEWKQDLEKDLKSVRSLWVWNWGKKQERPPDLGYFIGFKIAESYFNNSENKEKALIEILEMKDYESFYETSGF